jgi:hypothetical protein
MMVLNIVDATRWSKPIYFAMTVSEDNLMGLAPFLQAQGLVYKLMPEKVTGENFYNLDRTVVMIDSVFSLQGIGKAKNNDTSRRLLTNYLQIAFDLRRPMDNLRREVSLLKTMIEDEEESKAKAEAKTDADESAVKPAESFELATMRQQLAEAEKRYDGHKDAVNRFLDRCIDLIPRDWRPRAIRHEFFIDHGMIDEAIAAMERALVEDPGNSSHYETMLDQARNERERR